MALSNDDLIVRIAHKIVLPRSQIIFDIIIALLAATIAYYPYINFIGTEKGAQLNPITPQDIKDWGSVPPRVSVGLHITDMPQLDFVNNDFIIDGILWFEFDPAIISWNSISKFSFDRGEIIQQSEPSTQVSGNSFFVRYHIRVRFKTQLDFNYFPLDDHNINITLINQTVQPSEMIFRSYASFFSVPPVINTSGWRIYDTTTHIGWTKSVLDMYESQKIVAHPAVTFTISLRRVGFRNVMMILLPLFIMYFINLFSFAFDPKTNPTPIFYIASTGVPALLSYRFVIESMTPKVGYFVLSDYLFILFLVVAVIGFMFAANLLRIGKLTPEMTVVRGATFLMVHIVFISMWYFFLSPLWH